MFLRCFFFKEKFYKTHVSKKFSSAVNALTYKTRARPTYKYIFEKRGTFTLDLIPNIDSIFLPIAKQEPQGMRETSFCLERVCSCGKYAANGKCEHQFSGGRKIRSPGTQIPPGRLQSPRSSGKRLQEVVHEFLDSLLGSTSEI